MKKILLASAAIVALGSVAAWAGGYWTNGVPVAGQAPYTNTLPLTGNETIPADTNLAQGAQPQSEAIQTSQLFGYITSQPSKINANLVAGDAGQNLWQRGTTGTSSTSATVQWSSADHWGQWTLSSAGVKIVKDTTTADLPAGYSAMYALTHTTTTGGAVCMGQPLESANSYQFAGTTAELDFHAFTGAGYSGGTNAISAYIVYGTGTDDGLNKMAFTVNAGGATGWTGGVSTASIVPINAVSTSGRYGVAVAIPSTATEIGVAFCYTAGTTDTNDYVAFGGVQLVRNPALTSIAPTTTAVASTAQNLSSFTRDTVLNQALAQYRYYYQWNEADTANVVQSPAGMYMTTTACDINFPLPVPLFKTPTIQNTAISTTTFKIAPTAAGVALAGTGNGGLILQVGSTPVAPYNWVALSFITGAQTQYVACTLVSTAAGAGNFGVTAED